MTVLARAAQSLKLRAADAADAVRGRRDSLTPPRRLTGYVGDSDFHATGEEFLDHFQRLAGLGPGEKVLDVGCGIGRMARVLAPVLRPPGSYDGFDIVSAGIEWCREHYQDTPAPFRFQHADVRNATYNPGGAVAAADYRFPYDDASFDLVIATSVFTHLLGEAADHYLAQSARVLASGGRLFATWYLLDGVGLPPGLARPDAGGPAAIADPDQPEAMVAFDLSWLRSRLDAHGLPAPEVHPGTWAGRPGLSQQDIVVAYRV